MNLIAFFFRNYRLPKMWLDKYLKSPVSEHPSTINMQKRHKHCLNIQDSTFIKFFHHSVGN